MWNDGRLLSQLALAVCAGSKDLLDYHKINFVEKIV